MDGGFEPAQPSGEQDRTADSRMDPERIDYLGTVERYTEGLLKRLAPRA